MTTHPVLRYLPRPIRIIIGAIHNLILHSGLEMAGHLSFTALLAFFPFLIFVTALFGMAGSPDLAERLVAYLFEMTPPDVAKTLSTPVYEVMHTRRGDLLTFGGVAAVWAASSGIEAVREVLNKAYSARESRSFLHRRLHSILFVIATAGLMVLASLALVLGPVAWQILSRFIPLTGDDIFRLDLWRYSGAALLLGTVLLAMHRWLPDTRLSWRRLLPGVIVTLALWVIASSGLSIYLATLANYSATYGALGGVVITLLFFYISAVVFVFGAELNAALSPDRVKLAAFTPDL